MATLYYNAVVDSNWDTLGNWWQDATFYTPAVSLPTTAKRGQAAFKVSGIS